MAWVVVIASVGAVGVAAVLADGRVGTATRTNDGGAWLLNRSEDSIGHVNRVVGEIASVAGPFGGAFDVEQSDGVVVVNDRGTGEAVLIDTNLATPGAAVRVSIDTTVYTYPQGVVLFESSSGRLWRFARADFGAVATLDDVPPTLISAPGGVVAVGLDGTIALVEADGSAISIVRSNGEVEHRALAEPEQLDTDGIAVVGEVDLVTAITLVGQTPVFTRASGVVVVVGDKLHEYRVGRVVNLQQPSIAAENVVVVTDDEQVVMVNLDSGVAAQVAGTASDRAIRPIVHDNCVWSITLSPPTFYFCGQNAPLDGASTDLKLTLVNGWVWVNDVNLGGIWFVDENRLEVQNISDWSAALLLDNEFETSDDEAGGDEELINNANADELSDAVDELDDDAINSDPVAEDDEAATRQGRPVLIDVLANDSDSDNDPLSVDSLTNVDADGFHASGARVSITADGSMVQVIPNVDFVGDLQFGYVVHDGRQGRDSASVSLTVTEPNPDTNRPPITVIDNATVRAGQAVALNVVTNDHDPDGDTLVLVDADDLGGAVNYTPDGELQFIPDVTSPDGTVEIAYTVMDDYGAEATGTARIRVRRADSNQAPQARNDIGHTSVGHSVLLNVLSNDMDPDGDPLIAQNLQTVDGAVTSAQLSNDGQFMFKPEGAGTYRFTYTVSDGPTVDTAQVRISVDPPADNRPPIAVVDHIALAVGESRLVRVLDNDGDPDGDVVGVVDWVGAEGLEITEVPGVGFNVIATPTAGARIEFRYFISDGIAPPVSGTVVVSALQRDAVDYPPVAVVDTVDVRAGNTTDVYVLRNDYDPEGKVLRLVAPIAQPTEAVVRVAPDQQSLLLTVAADQQFSFQFSYDVEDPAGNRGSAVVFVRVVPPSQPNRSPVASPDVATTVASTPVIIPVRLNDSDPDGDPIAVESIAEQPANGSVLLLPDGNLQYTPSDGFTGTDRLVYTLVDGYQPPPDTTLPVDQRGPGRALGEVLIGVMPASSQNRPPIAVDDEAFAPIQIGGDAASLAVLANDSDPDDDPLVLASVTTASVGSVAVAPTRQALLYTPPSDGLPRVVSFSYTVSDGRGGTAVAQVTLDLLAAPEPVPPIAVDDTVGPVKARTVVAFDPRLNDLDPDGDRTMLIIESDDPGLSVLADGTVEITAPTATSEIEYRARDEQGLLSEPAFITVLVAANQAPVVEPIAVETPYNTPITIDVGASVSDPDADPLVITLGNQRRGGAATAVGTPAPSTLQVEFVPDTDFEGAATFDFVVDDRNGHTVSGAAEITVLPPENREPIAEASSVTAEAGIAAVVRLSDLVTDEDGPDGHVFSTSSVQGPISLSGPNAAGEVVIESDVTSGGRTASFEYTVVDDIYTVSNTVSVTLDVANFAPPSLGGDTARTLQGVPTGAISVLDNDVDNSPVGLAGDGLIVTGVGVSPDGTVQLNGASVVFTPTPSFYGTTSFSYTVQDGRRAAAGESVGTVTVDVIGRPAITQAPSVDSVGNGYLVVGWQAPQGDAARAPVTGYVLRYSASDGGSGEQIFTEPTTSYRWNGLTNAVEYCFQVAAVNEAGQGDFSEAGGDASCDTPDVRPEAPGSPQVDFDDSQLHLSWATPLNQGSAIRNFQVRISGGTQQLSAELGVVTSFTWQGLQNGTDYTFEVRAQNDALDNDGWSDWSPLSTPEHPLTLPDAPPQPSAQRGDRQVQVTWEAPGNGGDAISKYQLRSSLDETWVDVTPQGQTNSHVWENIPNGTDVSFVVRAINRDPTSSTPGNISPESPVVRTCTVPDAPATPSVQRGDTQVIVGWVAPSDQGCAITGYQITSNTGEVQNAGAGAVSHTFTGLSNNTPYTFTVTAINEVVTNGEAVANTSGVSASVIPAGPPMVSNVTEAVNTGARRVRVSWSAADPNGSAILRYELQINNGAWIDVGNVTTVTRTEGSDGATYTYRARAVNDVGPSTQTGSAQTVTTWSLPGTPNVSASASQNGDRNVTATWSAPSNGGTGLDSHQASILSSGSCNAGSIRTNPGSPETWSNRSNGTSYRVCVRYHNAVGWGPWGASGWVTPRKPARSVVARWGGSAQGQPGCSTSSCKYLAGTGYNFTPNSVVQVECWDDRGGWSRWSGPYSRTVASNGRVSFGNVCYFGYTGDRVRLRIGGVDSAPITN